MHYSVLKQRCRQIAVAGIGKQDDDVLACVFGTLRKPDRRICRRTGGNADQHAFLFADELAGRERILVRYRDDLVVDAGIEYVRNKARADALDLVRAGGTLGKYRRAFGLDRDDLDVGVL